MLKDARQISLLNGNLLNAIGALFFGAVIGFIGVVLHNAFEPIGIFLASDANMLDKICDFIKNNNNYCSIINRSKNWKSVIFLCRGCLACNNIYSFY